MQADCLSNHGLQLKCHSELHPKAEFTFANSRFGSPTWIKDRLHYEMTDILKGDDFVMDRDGLLSTHSVRKMAIIFALFDVYVGEIFWHIICFLGLHSLSWALE